MKGKRLLGSVLAAALVLALLAGLALAQGPAGSPVGTGFTYQGRLKSGGSPYSGTCDLKFGLWDALTNGNQLGTQPLPFTNVSLTDGYFTVQLDYGGGAFQGDARWLAIEVRCPAGGGEYTPLTPRQALTAAPHALALPGLWTQQNSVSPNLIGGHSGNWVTAGATGATIGGGGDINWPNRVTDDFGTVSGGQNNQAGNGDDDPRGPTHTTVGGGWQNVASGDFAAAGGGANNVAGGGLATVGGGHLNTASSSASTVGGGSSNSASGESATVGGGSGNTASGESATVGGGMSNAAGGWRATVVGGSSNTASGSGATVGGWESIASGGWATVGGGWRNIASGDKSTVGGGNENAASGWNATVPGGWDNIAQGAHSFAAGRHAKAYNDGCFVWGDSTDADVACNNADRWVARASGGVYFYTNGGLSSGVYVPAGGNAWSSVSDRNLKENVAAVDGQEVLARLAQVPIASWNYKSQEAAIRHMGPMAQDFYAAFGLGEDDTHISTVDADGVALAAIQGLQEQVQDKEARITALESENTAQRRQIDGLESRLAALEGAAHSSRAARPWQVGFLPGAGLLLVGVVWVARRGGGR